ncbi:MAG: VWA domain-containing protein [Planctomycetota bacterium]
MKSDQAGLVVFGKGARLELPPAPYPSNKEIRSIGSLIDRQHSDLAAGIKLALGSFPPDTSRRIVLISDGNQNRGDVLTQAVAAQKNAVPIDVVPIEYRYDTEILVDKVVLPPDLKKGDTANLKIVIRSSRPASGLLRLVRVSDDQSQTVLEQKVELREGLNVLFRTQTIEEPNFYTYEAQFEPDPAADDRLARNNQASTFTWIRGEGQVLLLESKPGEHRFLVERLRRDNLSVTVRSPVELKENLADLRQFDSVIVANVPAEELGEERQQLLATNTRELGAGLVMIGGEDSFGAGGYVGSTLEKALPVDMEVKSTKIRGKGALVLIMHACEIPEGNFWQKRIAKLAIQMLSANDECGLVFWDNQTSWLFPLQEVGDRSRMFARIDGMAPGDMPDFGSSMQQALSSLIKSQAMTKHVIVISDGDPQPPPDTLLTAYRDARITCSTVAVASHGPIETQLMQRIARQTKGRAYQAVNPKALPQIYIKETRVVSRPLLFEQRPPWNPLIVTPTEPVAGMPEKLPAISGFVLTTPKPAAEVAIVSPVPVEAERNPILAHWQYGLGKAVAFTTDAGERWASDWAKSELYDKFWSQLIRWSMRSAESENLSVSTQEKDGKVSVVVNAVDKSSDFLNFLNLRGKLIGPDVVSSDLAFRQTEPGKYEAEFPAEQSGSYFLRVGYRQPDGSEGFVSTGINVSYPPEYRDIESNRDLLENVASLAGGKVVEWKRFSDADFFPQDHPPTLRLQDAWPILLFLALPLFLADVAIRRIAVEPATMVGFAKRNWARWRNKPIPTSTEVVDRLRTVKAAVGEQLQRKRIYEATESSSPPEDIVSSTREPEYKDRQSHAPPTPLAPPTEKATNSEEDESYTHRLLRAKRKVREELDDTQRQ